MCRFIKMIRIKQYFKTFSRRLDSYWEFQRFEKEIQPQTWKRHDELLQWAYQCAKISDKIENPKFYKESEDPIVKQGYILVEEARRNFAGKYSHFENLRILVHTPSSKASPGGYSIFNNLIQALNFIGIPAKALEWNQHIEMHLQDFRPTVFITSDNEPYLAKINWDAVARYRKDNDLKVGLTASLEEYGNTPLNKRLDWAQKHQVDFYYSFRSQEYLHERKEYKPFFENGYQIYSIEFGANPLIYHPVPNINRDINFVFLASSNPDKRKRYFAFLPKLFSNYAGFIDGPGWSHISQWAPPHIHRFLYARAKVGINLHITDSIDWASELNERTHILAACGVPQLVDNAKLLTGRFSDDCFFVAETPQEYEKLFHHILNNPMESQKKALQAQKEVFSKHTTFHRAEDFITSLILNS